MFRHHKGSIDTNGTNPKNITASEVKIQQGAGKTGVEFRWYPKDDYLKLSNDQKDDHRRWLESEAGKKVLKDRKVSMKNLKWKSPKSENKFTTTKKFKRSVKKAAAKLIKKQKKETEMNDKISSLASTLDKRIKSDRGTGGSKLNDKMSKSMLNSSLRWVVYAKGKTKFSE